MLKLSTAAVNHQQPRSITRLNGSLRNLLWRQAVIKIAEMHELLAVYESQDDVEDNRSDDAKDNHRDNGEEAAYVASCNADVAPQVEKLIEERDAIGDEQQTAQERDPDPAKQQDASNAFKVHAP
jgi:hypothetical protein